MQKSSQIGLFHHHEAHKCPISIDAENEKFHKKHYPEFSNKQEIGFSVRSSG